MLWVPNLCGVNDGENWGFSLSTPYKHPVFVFVFVIIYTVGLRMFNDLFPDSAARTQVKTHVFDGARGAPVNKLDTSMESFVSCSHSRRHLPRNPLSELDFFLTTGFPFRRGSQSYTLIVGWKAGDGGFSQKKSDHSWKSSPWLMMGHMWHCFILKQKLIMSFLHMIIQPCISVMERFRERKTKQHQCTICRSLEGFSQQPNSSGQ